MKDFRCFKKGDVFDFRPGLNLMVGDQGCGKSSLFYSILNWQESGIAMDYVKDKGFRFLDTENMNPRLDGSFKAHKEFDSPDAFDSAKLESAIDRMVNDWDGQSHGQVMLPLILASKDKGVTFFIDEPEAGLSIRSQYTVLDHFKKVAKHSQLVVATHSLVLIESAKEVLSLEHKKWMSPAEFLKTQRTAKTKK